MLIPSAITEQPLVTATSPSIVYSMTIQPAATADSSSAEYDFDIIPQGEGQYFGFTVDGNHRLLLADFTVTHNSSLFNCLSNLNVPAENYPILYHRPVERSRSCARPALRLPV